jgi:uncharacterized protein with HEPN domain
VSPDARPDRHALLELQALLTQIAALRSEGDADRFTADARYRWILHRLWIATGNEALAYTQAPGQPVRADKTWANLYDLRNHLAHSRLPDIDEGLVRRFTRARLDSLQATTQHHLQEDLAGARDHSAAVPASRKRIAAARACSRSAPRFGVDDLHRDRGRSRRVATA